jgi:hypothetical protein
MSGAGNKLPISARFPGEELDDALQIAGQLPPHLSELAGTG